MIASENSGNVRAVATMWRSVGELIDDLGDNLFTSLAPLKEGEWEGEAAEAFYEQSDKAVLSFGRFPAATIASAIEPIATEIDTVTTLMAGLQAEFDERMNAASTYSVDYGDKVNPGEAQAGLKSATLTVEEKTKLIYVGSTKPSESEQARTFIGEVKQQIRTELTKRAKEVMTDLVKAYRRAQGGLIDDYLGPENLRFEGPLNANLNGVPVAFGREPSPGGRPTNGTQENVGLPDGALLQNGSAATNESEGATQQTGIPEGALTPDGNNIGSSDGTDGTGGGTGTDPQDGLPPGALRNQTGIGRSTGIPVELVGGSAALPTDQATQVSERTGLPAGALVTPVTTTATTQEIGLPAGALSQTGGLSGRSADTTRAELDRNALTSRSIPGGAGLPAAALQTPPTTGTGGGPTGGAPTAPPHPGTFARPPDTSRGNLAGRTGPTGVPSAPGTGPPPLSGRRTSERSPAAPTGQPRTRTSRQGPATTTAQIAGRTDGTPIAGPTMPHLPGASTMPSGTPRPPRPTLRRRPVAAPTPPGGADLIGRQAMPATSASNDQVGPALDGRSVNEVPATDVTLARRRGSASAPEAIEEETWTTPPPAPAVLDTPRKKPTPDASGAIGRSAPELTEAKHAT